MKSIFSISSSFDVWLLYRVDHKFFDKFFGMESSTKSTLSSGFVNHIWTSSTITTREGKEGTFNWRTDFFADTFKQQANEEIVNTLSLTFGSQIKM